MGWYSAPQSPAFGGGAHPAGGLSAASPPPLRGAPLIGTSCIA